MNCWRYTLLLSLLGVSSNVIAQTTDTTDYLPLNVGNTWTYFQVLYPPNMPPDTLWKGTYSVTETVSINDTLYFVFDQAIAFAEADTLRTNEAGRIWARIQGQDVLLFDFSLSEGEMYRFQTPDLLDIHFQVTVERDQTIDVGAGHFVEGITLRFDDPQWIDEERSFTFAPGVGIVRMYGGLGDYEELFWAEVGGQIITATEATDPLSGQTLQALAYPNPFRSSTTLVVSFTGSIRPTVGVHDVLGRKVGVLQAEACTLSRCRFSWDGFHLGSGVYYVRIDQGGQVETIPLILRR